MKGELLSLLVAVMWTFTAILAEVASRRMGTLTLNVWRMILTILLLALTLWCVCDSPLPQYADAAVWGWFLASGFMGFVFGDYCLFNAYMCIGSRFAQLFMTLASPFAALAAWVLLGEQMTWICLLGMVVTLSGIGISIMGKNDDGKRRVKLPLRGVLLGIGAGMGQGVGLVLSKIGLQYYDALIPATDEAASFMMPFAGTQIRAVMGLIGFGTALLFTRQAKTLVTACSDRKAVAAALGTIMLGPFFGVSLSLMAVNMTHAGVAQTLMALTPVFILWPSHVIFGSKITLQEVVGAVIAVAGASLFFL